MNIQSLTRNGEFVIGSMKEVGDSLVATRDLKIYLPITYESSHLLFINGEEYDTVGIFPIVVNDTVYGIMSMNSKLKLIPEEVNKVVLADDHYYELSFSSGSVICPNINVVQDDVLTYYIYDYFIGKAMVPWFMSYSDMAKIFDTAREYAGARTGDSPEVISLLISIIARQADDRTKHYRHGYDGKNKMPPVFIPISSVDFGATNTFNKLAGNYFDIGVASSLLHPTTKVEKIESIIRA